MPRAWFILVVLAWNYTSWLKSCDVMHNHQILMPRLIHARLLINQYSFFNIQLGLTNVTAEPSLVSSDELESLSKLCVPTWYAPPSLNTVTSPSMKRAWRLPARSCLPIILHQALMSPARDTWQSISEPSHAWKLGATFFPLKSLVSGLRREMDFWHSFWGILRYPCSDFVGSLHYVSSPNV